MEAVYIEQWGLWEVRGAGQRLYVKARDAAEAIILAERRMEARHDY